MARSNDVYLSRQQSSEIPPFSPSLGLCRITVILLVVLSTGWPGELAAQQSAGNAGPQTVPVPQELSPPESPAAEPPSTEAVARPDGAVLLAQARELRDQRKLRDAFPVYRLWLEQNPESPDYGGILAEATSWAPDVYLSVELLRRYGPGVKDPGLREELVIRHSRLLMASGRLEEAMALLSDAGSSAERAYLKALLFYEQGEFEQTLDVLREALSDLTAASRIGSATTRATDGAGKTSQAGASTPDVMDPARDAELSARLYFVMAQAYGALGRAGEAESLFLLLQKRFSGTEIAPAAYLAYQRLLGGLGRSSDAAAVGAELRLKFPNAPEAGLSSSPSPGDGVDVDTADRAEGAGRLSVAYAPTPLELLPQEILQFAGEDMPKAAPEDTREAISAVSPESVSVASSQSPAPEASAPIKAGATISAPKDVPPASNHSNKALVQVGSFRDPENARYMVGDLKEAGFAAQIQDKNLDGKLYYRVVIEPPLFPADAEKLMLRLKDAGFEGFLLFPD